MRTEASCDDAGLTEAAADLLLEPTGACDEIPRSCKAGADRRVEGVGEAHADGIERGRIIEGLDGGVVAVNVVADFGFGHGRAHFGRRPATRITSEIDHVSSRFLSRLKPRPIQRLGRSRTRRAVA